MRYRGERQDGAPKAIVKSAEAARAGSISGRVVTVLGISLLLGVLLTIAMLAIWWSWGVTQAP